MSAHAELGYRERANAAFEATPAEGRCAAPGCAETPPAHCPFCATHHFALPPGYARAVLRARARADRAPIERRAGAQAEYRAFLTSCINTLKGGRA